MTGTTTSTASTYLFRKADGETQFLTLLRSRHLELGGTWQAVHGKIEPGEKASEAALREVREETGLEPVRLFVVNHVEVLYDPRADQIALVPIFAAEVLGDPKVTLSGEHERAEWCSVADALRRFIWPTQRDAIRRIVEDIAEATQPNRLLQLA